MRRSLLAKGRAEPLRPPAPIGHVTVKRPKVEREAHAGERLVAALVVAQVRIVVPCGRAAADEDLKGGVEGGGSWHEAIGTHHKSANLARGGLGEHQDPVGNVRIAQQSGGIRLRIEAVPELPHHLELRQGRRGASHARLLHPRGRREHEDSLVAKAAAQVFPRTGECAHAPEIMEAGACEQYTRPSRRGAEERVDR